MIDVTVAPFNTVLNGLKSYIMEIWYYKDNILPVANIETNTAATRKNYIFYSNTFRLYWDYTNALAKKFVIEYNYGINTIIDVPATTALIDNSWNKLIFNVFYNSTNPPTNTIYSYNFEFFTKNIIQGTAKFSVGTVNSPTDQSLKYIVWSHQDPDTTIAEISGIYWHSGFYRDLRIWDGNQVNPWALTQYNMFYNVSSSAFSSRVNGIKLYFPFDLENSNVNIIKDPVGGTSYNVNSAEIAFNAFNLQSYYILTQFEYSDTSGNSSKFFTSISISGFNDQSNNLFLILFKKLMNIN